MPRHNPLLSTRESCAREEEDATVAITYCIKKREREKLSTGIPEKLWHDKQRLFSGNHSAVMYAQYMEVLLE